jgi:hypothetical protein
VKDYQASLEKLRQDVTEAALIRDLATDKAKQGTVQQAAVHFSRLEAKDSA